MCLNGRSVPRTFGAILPRSHEGVPCAVMYDGRENVRRRSVSAGILSASCGSDRLKCGAERVLGFFNPGQWRDVNSLVSVSAATADPRHGKIAPPVRIVAMPPCVRQLLAVCARSSERCVMKSAKMCGMARCEVFWPFCGKSGAAVAAACAPRTTDKCLEILFGRRVAMLRVCVFLLLHIVWGLERRIRAAQLSGVSDALGFRQRLVQCDARRRLAN